MAPIVGRAEDRRGNSVANDGKSWTFALPRAQGLLPASAAIVLARTLDRGAPGRVAARVGPLRAGRCLEVAPRAAARFAALVQSTVLASATQLRRSGRVGLRRRRASRLSGERSAVRQNLAGSRSGPGAAYHLEQRGAGPWPGAANSTHRSVGPSGRLAHERGVSRRGRTRLACRRRAATKARRRRYFRRSKSQTIRPGRRGHVAGGPESYGGNQSGIRRGDRHHARRLRLVAPLARSGTKAGSQSTGPAQRSAGTGSACINCTARSAPCISRAVGAAKPRSTMPRSTTWPKRSCGSRTPAAKCRNAPQPRRRGISERSFPTFRRTFA